MRSIKLNNIINEIMFFSGICDNLIKSFITSVHSIKLNNVINEIMIFDKISDDDIKSLITSVPAILEAAILEAL